MNTMKIWWLVADSCGTWHAYGMRLHRVAGSDGLTRNPIACMRGQSCLRFVQLILTLRYVRRLVWIPRRVLCVDQWLLLRRDAPFGCAPCCVYFLQFTRTGRGRCNQFLLLKIKTNP
ncbi:hypothetical protein ACLKA6_005629 [Drosophila palustris]